LLQCNFAALGFAVVFGLDERVLELQLGTERDPVIKVVAGEQDEAVEIERAGWVLALVVIDDVIVVQFAVAAERGLALSKAGLHDSSEEKENEEGLELHEQKMGVLVNDGG